MTRVLIAFPEILLIQVKRYDHETGKIKTNVWPEDVIHLSTGETYQLSGIGHHIGETSKSGHYVASVKTASGWIRCNDTKITFSNEKDIKSLLCDFCVYYKVKVGDTINPPLKRVFNEDEFPPLGRTQKKRLIYDDDQNFEAIPMGSKTTSTCKNCGKTFILLLSHLTRAKNCQTGYDIDEMKKEYNRQKQRDFRNRKKRIRSSKV